MSRRGRFSALALGLASLGLVRCTFIDLPIDIPELPEHPTETLTFTRTEDGRLEYCDAEQRCAQRPNPDDCLALHVQIDTVNGETCERCEGAAGHVIYERCDATSVVCTVVTIPEPDCVVCGFRDGSVIYTSCTEQPPQDCRSVADIGGTTCKQCYDEGNYKVYDSCIGECARISCPAVACAEGSTAMRLPGECCERCVPDNVCDGLECPQEHLSVPECPAGSTLVRDPLSCCHLVCTASECPPHASSICPEGDAQCAAELCPPGYRWDAAYPSCGRCVLEEPSYQYCASSNECADDEECTTERDVCLVHPECASGEACASVCYGSCAPKDQECATTSAENVLCEGTLQSPGFDERGCPLPPVCVCPDGVTSFDGHCTDQCTSTQECPAMALECGSGYVLSTAYPDCCGKCVPDPNYNACDGSTCTTVACGEGYHPEPGPDCCPVCVRDFALCRESSECAASERCTKDYGEVAHCEFDPAANSQLCYGECRPRCEDLDGVAPAVASKVIDRSGDERAEYRVDYCLDAAHVVEFWCGEVTPGSGIYAVQSSVFDCQAAGGQCLMVTQADQPAKGACQLP